ncbi:hypothetical protein MHU86_20500 [Fragilaria crotonensis]|nr:hypothetical protein MHU86_20500 [Fragilaria crotonensis]
MVRQKVAIWIIKACVGYGLGVCKQCSSCRFKYYLRLDDDSLFTDKLPFDPFQQMDKDGLLYAWRRDSYEEWGLAKLNELVKRHIRIDDDALFTSDREFWGSEPYNNFHVSRVSFWASQSGRLSGKT